MKTKIIWRLKTTAVLLTFIGLPLFAPSSFAQLVIPGFSQRGVELINGTSSGPAPAESQHLDADGARRFAKLSPNLARASQPRQLSLADRVAYQRAIEEVYWRHRIWAKERPDPKPLLDEVMPPAQLAQKVEDYLRNSQALEDYWQQPVSAEQLQAEMERMAQNTKKPEVLRELFAVLGNDPFVIAECLARPTLSERLVTNFYAHDQRFHGELRRRAEADLRDHQTVKEMKQTSGTYSEIEWVKSDNDQEEGNGSAETSLRINSRDWAKHVQKLEALFGGGQTGLLNPLQEDEWRYYATAVIMETKDRLKLATIEWRKEPFESWRARAEDRMPKVMAAPATDYALPTISDPVNGFTEGTRTATSTTNAPAATPGCTDDTWTATSTINVPTGRNSHTAVWTGSEMIIWGGLGEANASTNFNTGGRYNPGTNSWTATSTTNAPTARSSHTAVWTGSEMIIWGGFDGSSALNTGGGYHPDTDSWTATSNTNAAVRSDHTAVWTGSEMIVWGGMDSGGTSNTGGRYHPGTDSWTATSMTNAPTARELHTAVWTGSEMIVWGGYDSGGRSNTGGRYNPGTDSWIATSTTNAAGRGYHTAVWTGGEMIVWGGIGSSGFSNTGGRYHPETDSWTATSTTNAPFYRIDHTAVWTGSEMIVWGGYYVIDLLNTGGRYNPGTDSWTATSTTNAPTARYLHTTVWTGSEMIVWGGEEDRSFFVQTGGRYCAQPPITPTPSPMPTPTPHGSPHPTPTPHGSPHPTPIPHGTPHPTPTPNGTPGVVLVERPCTRE